ncbi:MAG TPA: cysteine hydrolase family protein [Thermoanaerobaculia bacterium]|nr:cysteine hydrolase family protein [Thermoanaerobaculia bacterium]
MAQPAPIEQSALLVIDIQDSFKLGSRWDRRNNPEFESNVTRLVGAWREAGLPVFFILHNDPDPGFEAGSPLVKVMDFLSPRENEPTLTKNTRNSFTSTDLQKRLDALGVRRLVITGISTEQCCETTTRVAADLGYDVDFVTEATRTFPIVNAETGDVLSTDEIVRRTEFVLRGRFATIATVDRLVEELQKAAVPCNG